jgi:hypothetical protein
MSPRWEMLHIRLEQTTKAAKAIVDAESIDRAAKTVRLREARLAAKSATPPMSLELAPPQGAGGRA